MSDSLCPSSPVVLEVDRASDEAFDKLRVRLREWLPFATVARSIGWLDDSAGTRAVHALVGVCATELAVTMEILGGFFSVVRASSADQAGVTFLDEGSAPPIFLHLIPSGSVLDDSFRFGNAHRNCGGLLGGGSRSTELITGEHPGTGSKRTGIHPSDRQWPLFKPFVCP